MHYRVPLQLILVAVILGGQAASAVMADDAKATDKKKAKTVDPSGTWRWERERNNGQIVKNQLKIDLNDDNKVVATYYGLIDGLKSTNGSIEGDKLTLDFDVERDGYSFQAKYEGTIKGDNVAGTISLSSSDGSRDFPWEAKRSVELSDVVGTWNLRLESSDGNVHEPTLTVVKKGEKYVGTYVAGELGEFPVSDLKAKDNLFTFTLAGELNGSEFVAHFTTYPKGSKLKGDIELEIGDRTIDMELSGRLTKKSG